MNLGSLAFERRHLPIIWAPASIAGGLWALLASLSAVSAGAFAKLGINVGPLWWIAAASIGFAIGFVAPYRRAAVGQATILGGVCTIAIASITFGQFDLLPHILVIIGGTLTALATNLVRHFDWRGQQAKRAAALDGVVANPVLNFFTTAPEKFDSSDRELPISTLLIHVVGLRTILEGWQTVEAAGSVRNLLQMIRKTAHKYNAIVEPAYRDGFICHFGYNFTKDSQTGQHCDQAVATAAEILHTNIRNILQSAGTKQPLFTLKAYVDSGVAYIANLGDETAPRFGVLAPHVDRLAKLQGQSESQTLTMTRNVWDALTGAGVRELDLPAHTLRLDAEESVECRVYDPTSTSPHIRKQCYEIITEALSGGGRRETRFDVLQTGRFEVMSELGPVKVLNVSRGGLAVTAEQKMTKGQTLKLTFINMRPDIEKRLRSRNLHEVAVAVRWQRLDETPQVQGLMYTALPFEDKTYLLAALLDQLGASAAATYFNG